MRILAVTPYYEPEGGGLERYAHEILSRLALQGHDVHVLAFTKTGLADATKDGVKIHRRRPWMRLGNSPVDPFFYGDVREALRRMSPDVVVAHTPVPFPAEVASMAARRAGVPFVVTYHAGRLRGSSRFLDAIAAVDRATLERRMLGSCARLIAVSPFVRDHALGRHRDRVTIVPPGVDATRFTPAGEPRPGNVLFVGPLSRAYRWKGIDTLWRAFERVRAAEPQASLTLVGDGNRRPEFERQAHRMQGAVRFTGRLGDDQLVDEYRRAAVVVLPSVTDAESFGMVLAEANACARPVVASHIGGIPDFVRHEENGLLARPSDPEDLAAKIHSLLEDPDHARRLGANGRERVIRDHDWAVLTAATEKVLEDAAGRRAPETPRAALVEAASLKSGAS